MGFLDTLLRPATPASAALSTVPEPGGGSGLDTAPVAVADSSTSPHSIEGMTNRAERVAIDLALGVPAVRKALHVLGTIATFELHAYDADGRMLESTGDRAWLAQPEMQRPRQWTMSKTLQDLVWHDRAVWRIVNTSAWGVPVAFERINPKRIQTVADPLDDDLVDTWIIDGRQARPDDLLVFDGAGLGGLRRFGYDLLTIYGQLQAAAGRYARAPQPYGVLENSGADLDPKEISDLLDTWERARESRGVGYTNDVIEYKVIQGYSARELQLTEAREHAALEVARLFGLPAFALDANQPGSSMTYGNVVERRRDLLESLRPWMGVFEGTFSALDRRGRVSGRLLAHTHTVRFDSTAYTRDAPEDRMQTWEIALRSGVLTLDEVRAAEPLTRS